MLCIVSRRLDKQRARRTKAGTRTMLGGWLHDAGGGGGGSESVALPFARGGRSSAASSQPRGGHQQQHAGAEQLQPPSRRPHYPSPEGPVFDLDPSSVVEVGWVGCVHCTAVHRPGNPMLACMHVLI